MIQKLITALILIAVGIGLGSQLFPKIKVETVETEKIVTVKDVVTVTKVITKPDGTSETTTTTTDKSKEAKQASSTTKVAKTDWHTSLAATTGTLSTTDLTYTLNIDRRILGDLYIGIALSSDKKAGLSIGLDF